MRLHDYIFSDARKIRIVRHLVFWASWWLYFFLCYYLYQLPLPHGSKFKPFYLTLGPHLPIKICLLVILYSTACYPLIYLILPQLLKSKWLKPAATFLLVCFFLFIGSYFLYWNVFGFVDSLFEFQKAKTSFPHAWAPISLGLLNFIKVAAAALVIKYVKYLWLKQKEKEKLAREKLQTELQLLKAQIQPGFLITTLDTMYTHALSASSQAPGMLLKLSELLSYTLYECDKNLVPLDKEIAMMKEYMELERMKQKPEFEMEINIKGRGDNKQIAPFLLFPFIENSFLYCSSTTEQSWINMNLVIEEDSLSMMLVNSIPDTMNLQDGIHGNGLIGVQKRLSLLYPERHELKITCEQEMFIVLLKIRLYDSISNSPTEEHGVLDLQAATYE